MVNLVGKVPPLEASGAAVTLVHPTATTVAGQWDVTYPQDMPEEERPNLGPTRTFGYAHRLVKNPPRFARRHVRRDVQIDARDINGWSNAESQLDSAARELSGDVVFQRTLTGDDLGVLVPNVDFKQGDVLPLLVWGMIVPATCTSIRYTLEDGRRAVEVGFGPDLQADTAGLAETMSQIDRQMRAEAAGIDEYLAKQLDEAKAASEQQMDGLKTYVDEQDTASRGHADTVAGNALESAKADATTKAGNALTTARKDAQGYADTAQSQAEAYARRKDVENLKSAKEYAKDQFDEAQEALTKYREQVTGIIGKQGTITTKLDKLNKDYTQKLGTTGTIIKDIEGIKESYRDLSRDITTLSRENQTRVKDQRFTQGLIEAMVTGEPHGHLTSTQFQQHQQSVNKMQSAFNKKQVDINTGFQGLFDAQSVTNAMQAEFNRKQVSVNKGFQNLFQAQAFTNEMQNAFNKKQVGINKVYDAMWEQQQYTDLAQNYLIEYNRILAESRQPQIKKVIATGTIDPTSTADSWSLRVQSALENEGFDITYVDVFSQSLRIDLLTGFGADGFFTGSFHFWEQTKGGPMLISSGALHTWLGDNFLRGELTNPIPNKSFQGKVELMVVALPVGTWPSYQSRLDALTSKYRAKGLRV